MEKVAVIDFTKYLKGEDSIDLCKEVARSFRETGILIVKDPRLDYKDNDTFIDLLEKYYELPTEEKEKDARPQAMFQVGSTPEGNEFPRDNSHIWKDYKEENKPIVPSGYDHKWRFFWRAGERPKQTKFETLNEPQVIPKGFDTWEKVMNG